MGTMKNRVERILTDEDISKISDTVQSGEMIKSMKILQDFAMQPSLKKLKRIGLF